MLRKQRNVGCVKLQTLKKFSAAPRADDSSGECYPKQGCTNLVSRETALRLCWRGRDRLDYSFADNTAFAQMQQENFSEKTSEELIREKEEKE